MKKENHLIIEEALQLLNKRKSLNESSSIDDLIFDKILETVEKSKSKDVVYVVLDTALEDSRTKMYVAAINKAVGRTKTYYLDYYVITDPDDTIEYEEWVNDLFSDTFLSDIWDNHHNKNPREIYNILTRNVRRDAYILRSNEDPTVNVLIKHDEEISSASMIVYKFLKELLPEEFLQNIELYKNDYFVEIFK